MADAVRVMCLQIASLALPCHVSRVYLDKSFSSSRSEVYGLTDIDCRWCLIINQYIDTLKDAFEGAQAGVWRSSLGKRPRSRGVWVATLESAT
jgi:hypothetical protein